MLTFISYFFCIPYYIYTKHLPVRPNDIKFFRKLIVAIALIIGLQIAGVIGFMCIEGYSFVEAFYMTIIIVSTVGLGAVRDLSPDGRLFVVFMIIVSLGLFTYAISVITTYIVDGQLNQYLKYRNVRNKIEKLEGHVLVCGYGRNGRQACEQLRIHHRPYVVVESNAEVIAQLHKAGDVLFVEGDATKDEVLIEAGINRSKALISTLPNDADNVFVVLTARGLNQTIKIISRASEDASFSKIKRAGADNVIMPDKIGGVHMASLVAQPDVLEFVDVITGKAGFDLEEISFEKCNESVIGKRLGDLHLFESDGINVLGMKTADGQYIINPPASTIVTRQMKLFVLGTTGQVESFQAKLSC